MRAGAQPPDSPSGELISTGENAATCATWRLSLWNLVRLNMARLSRCGCRLTFSCQNRDEFLRLLQLPVYTGRLNKLCRQVAS